MDWESYGHHKLITIKLGEGKLRKNLMHARIEFQLFELAIDISTLFFVPLTIM